MLKATAEIYWEAQSAQDVNRASNSSLNGWLKKIKPFLHYLVTLPFISINALRAQETSDSIDSKGNSNLLSAFLLRKQHEVREVEQIVKDSFFYNQSNKYHDFVEPDETGWKNIPPKSWKRHSALLVYGQQLRNQKKAIELEANQVMSSTTNKLASVDKRISFKVKSIRHVPVWSTSLSEMELIENDFNTSRIIDIEKLSNDLAKAA